MRKEPRASRERVSLSLERSSAGISLAALGGPPRSGPGEDRGLSHTPEHRGSAWAYPWPCPLQALGGSVTREPLCSPT